MRLGKHLSAIMSAALILAIATAGASALRIEVRGAERGITATSGSVTFAGESDEVICAVTLRGTMVSSAENPEGRQIGSVTGGSVNSGGCTDTNFFANIDGRLGAEMFPWPLVYDGLSGNEILLTVEGAVFALDVTTFGAECLYEGEVPVHTDPGPAVESLITDANLAVLFPGEDEVCPPSGELNATFSLSPNVTVTLI